MRVTQPPAGSGAENGGGGLRFIFLRSPAGGVAGQRRDILTQRPSRGRPAYRLDSQSCPRVAGNPTFPLPSSFPDQVHPAPERKGTAVAAQLRLRGPSLGRTVPPGRRLLPGEAPAEFRGGSGKVTRSHLMHPMTGSLFIISDGLMPPPNHVASLKPVSSEES